MPVGGYFTIGPETATKVCEQLKPKIAIPMHYRMPELRQMFDLLKTVDVFLGEKKNIERLRGPAVEIEQSKLPKEMKIIVLSRT